MTDKPERRELPDPWWVPSDENLAALTSELRAEIPRGHALYGRGGTAVSRCSACDEAVFRLDEDRFAMVHLTWSGKAETAPWPQCSETGDSTTTWSAQLQHGLDHGFDT